MPSLTADQALILLHQLEPALVRAADLACELQATAVASRKNHCGSIEGEIVTTADLQVQESVLQALAQTELRDCYLLAEETTPSTALFQGNVPLTLTLDPIDGTFHYADQQPSFSLIVGLHTPTELLYTFCHFPRLAWTHRFVRTTYTVTGEKPLLTLPPAAARTVIYSFGEPNIAPTDPVIAELAQRNLGIAQKKQCLPEAKFGATALYLAGYVPGLYVPNPNAYDGLVGLHFAQTQHHQLFSKGDNGPFRFDQAHTNEAGRYYPGYYLALAP